MNLLWKLTWESLWWLALYRSSLFWNRTQNYYKKQNVESFFTDYSYFFYKSLKFNETFAQHQSLILSLQEAKRAHRKYLHLKMRSIKNCKTEFFLSKWIKIIFWRRNNATVLFSLVISGCSKILKITRDYLLLVISSPHLFPFIHMLFTQSSQLINCTNNW